MSGCRDWAGLLQGFAALVLASNLVPIAWDAAAVATAVWAVAGGVALFVGILVLQATLAFWTIESLEIANVFTYGGVQAAQYPLNIYATWFRRLLTFAVPLACVAYYPVLAILKRSDPLGAPDWLLPLTPLAGFAFLALSFVAWRAGMARYTFDGELRPQRGGRDAKSKKPSSCENGFFELVAGARNHRRLTIGCPV